MAYIPEFVKPYPDGWQDGYGFTEVSADYLNMVDKAIITIEEYLEAGCFNDIYAEESMNLGRKADSAIGAGSMTAGQDNVASGAQSMAVGYANTVTGAESFGIGRSNTVSGNRSGAMGSGNTVDDDYAFAMGDRNKASGYASNAEGSNNEAGDDYSHAEGSYTKASGKYSHSEGYYTEASGNASHAEGLRAKAKGEYSHAEGEESVASGDWSHAEGKSTTASGYATHAEGNYAKATGRYSHAENYGVEASGDNSHAEGEYAKAAGNNSHAEGSNTIASGEAQHVQGKWNEEDTESKYAHIVGGGSSSERKNIHTLDWEGNAVFAGNVTDGTGKSLSDAIVFPADEEGNANYGTAGQRIVTNGDGTVSYAEDITSTTSPSMSHSHPGRLLLSEIGGVCEQGSTTGAQLAESMYNSEATDVYATVLYLEADLQPSTQYTLSFVGTVGNEYYLNEHIYSNDGPVNVVVESGITSIAFETVESLSRESTNYYGSEKGWVILKNNSATNTAHVFDDLMLNVGSTAQPYEPYTGGTASPNPDYPQEIYTVKGKNLLDCRGLEEQTVNGVTFTPVYDANGNLEYIEANGTATEDVSFIISDFTLKGGESYILNGCPSDGSTSTFHLYAYYGGNMMRDTGSGITLSVNEDTSASMRIDINSGTVATNLRFYPMIRPASVADDTYVPYGLLRVKTHGKNLLDCRGLEEQTINGVTFTPVYDANGNLLYIEANGTATEQAEYTIAGTALLKEFDTTNCIISGCPSGGSSSAYMVAYLEWDTSWNEEVVAYDYGNGTSIDRSVNMIYANVRIIIITGQTVSGLRFYPMIRPASVADDTYVSYGLLRVKTHGKNMLDCRGLTEQTINGVTFTPVYDANRNLLYIEANGTVGDGSNSYYYIENVVLPSGGYILTGCPADGDTNATYSLLAYLCGGWLTDIGNGYEKTLDGANAASGDYVAIKLISGYTATNLRFYPMIRETSVEDATYEPYTESSITLSEPIELCGIGDVQDVIDVENGVVRKRFGKIQLSADWAWNAHSIGTRFYSLQSIGQAQMTDGENGIFTHFRTGIFDESGKAFVGFDTVQLRYDDIADVDALKTWLGENEVYARYILAEEVVTDLPTADRIALNSLATFDGATYLEWDCYLEPTFAGEYGTSKVGGYALEGLLTGRNSEIIAQSNADRLTALEAAVVNNVQEDEENV